MRALIDRWAAYATALLLLICSSSAAQETPFPQKGPIEITVLFPAGSSADITARVLAEGMARQLAANVIVVNRPGAGGAIGYRHVAEQKPDGYTLVWNSNSISTTFHSGQLSFDFRAFDAVARVLAESPVLAVRGDSKWRTLSDLLSDAKSRRDKITVGNSGIGSHPHISSAPLFKAAGLDSSRCYAAARPCRGGAPSVLVVAGCAVGACQVGPGAAARGVDPQA